MGWQNSLVTGDAPQRAIPGVNKFGRAAGKITAIGTTASSAAVDVMAEAGAARAEQVVIHLIGRRAPAAVSPDGFHAHFGVSNMAAATVADMYFPYNVMHRVKVEGKQSFIRVFNPDGTNTLDVHYQVIG